MQQVHAEGSVRHAEKRRAGTCQFANRVARVSLDAYERAVPESYRDANKQTCVAAIVAHFARPLSSDGGCMSSNNDNLQVIGLGVGTKFLTDATLREEQQLPGAADGASSDECYGKRVRDCHAEVLARRAFRAHLSREILSDLTSSSGKGERRTEEGSTGPNCNSILERVEDCADSSEIRYRLRSEVTLHFYASSAPCA